MIPKSMPTKERVQDSQTYTPIHSLLQELQVLSD